jgi:hypothetical protein
MRSLGNRRVAALAVGALIALAIVGWAAARQIRSPAQVAADTASPQPAPITVPVERRTLSTEVIVRGTVRYGAAQPAVLATSRVKQGSDIVTRAPRRKAELGTGDVALAVDGRPVFVLPGALPMSRDLHEGVEGPDVFQLEQALARMGFAPGSVDGRYDAGTEAAVSNFYLRQGWAPFGPTDLQLEQLRTAETAAAQARDAHLQALNTIEQAKTATPAEVEQARLDAVAAQDALDTAVLAVPTAEAKLATARTSATSPRPTQTSRSSAPPWTARSTTSRSRSSRSSTSHSTRPPPTVRRRPLLLVRPPPRSRARGPSSTPRLRPPPPSAPAGRTRAAERAPRPPRRRAMRAWRPRSCVVRAWRCGPRAPRRSSRPSGCGSSAAPPTRRPCRRSPPPRPMRRAARARRWRASRPRRGSRSPPTRCSSSPPSRCASTP